MTTPSDKDKWLYQFERPAFHERARLREILADMNIAPPEEVRDRQTPSSMLQETLDQVMAKLVDALEGDYAKNLVEQKNAQWGFDYVVSEPAPNTGKIDVFTRLFDPADPSKGKIFYGRTIKRIADDNYFLWIDD